MMNNVNEGFPKTYRILNSKDFSYLKDNASYLKTGQLHVYYKPSLHNSTFTRIGFSISKKVGKSWHRNKIKRCLKEFFRTSSYKDLGLDCLFVVRNSKNDCDLAKFKDLKSDFENLLIGLKSKLMRDC